MAIDSHNNLVVDDTSNHQVRVVPPVSGTYYGTAMTAGDIYTVAGNGTNGFSGDGGAATSAELSGAFGIATDAHKNVIIADATNKTGYSGDGGLATSAKFDSPRGVAEDLHGNLVIADTLNTRVRVVAAATGTYYGISMTAHHIYTVAGNGTVGYSGDGGKATLAEISAPTQGIDVDSHGNLVLPDRGNNRIRVVAASTGTFYGKSMTANDIYTVAGDGTAGSTGDGGKATLAELSGPYGVTVDANGNLVIADSGNGVVRVVAESTATFYGQAMTKKDIYTVAGNGVTGFSGDGGPATSAEFNLDEAVAVDGNGNIVVSDDHNDRIRVVAASSGTFYSVPMTAGDVYTVAGDGTIGYAGDGGAATSAELYLPTDVVVDSKGNLDLADGGNGRIRQVGP